MTHKTSDNSYFISYFSGSCMGRISVKTLEPIMSIVDIERLEKTISKEHGLKDVTILYWKRFEDMSDDR